MANHCADNQRNHLPYVFKLQRADAVDFMIKTLATLIHSPADTVDWIGDGWERNESGCLSRDALCLVCRALAFVARLSAAVREKRF